MANVVVPPLPTPSSLLSLQLFLVLLTLLSFYCYRHLHYHHHHFMTLVVIIFRCHNCFITSTTTTAATTTTWNVLCCRYNVLSYTNMFFTSKNTIVIVLLIYRLIVVQVEKRRDRDEDVSAAAAAAEAELLKERTRRLAECVSLAPSTCSGKTRLVQSSSSYSNGLYSPQSRCATPYRDDSSVGSLGSLNRLTAGGGGNSGGGRWSRTYTVETLNSPV